MKPTAERYQAATQVNVVSPEIVHIERADRVTASGRQYGGVRNGEGMATFPGSQTAAWYRMDRVGTWETLAGPRRGYPQTSRKGKDAETLVRESDSLIVLRARESSVHVEMVSYNEEGRSLCTMKESRGNSFPGFMIVGGRPAG